MQTNLFVQEEDDGYRPQPSVVPNGFEEIERLPQSVLAGIFSKDHVVGRAGRHEDDGRHVVEALNPLAPLVSLPSDIEHAAETKKRQMTPR